MNNKTEVIILKNSDYRDADALLNVLSKDYGKMTFVARGIRKPKSKNANSCSLFQQSIFHFDLHEQRSMQSLRTAELKYSYRKIREDLTKQSIASIMVEAMDKIDIEVVEESFELLETSLRFLDTTDNPMALLGLYIARICEMCGIDPYVDGCVRCQREDHLTAISLNDGGFICSSCFNENLHIKKDRSVLKFFRLFNKADITQFPLIEEITPCNYSDIEDILAFFMEYSGVNLRSLKFLQHISNLQ